MKTRIRNICSLVFLCIMISTSSWGQVCDVIYVSTLGNNGNPGNASLPVATLSEALTRVSGTRTNIRIAGGNYTENTILNILDNVHIEGGFSVAGSTWTKSSMITTTITFSGEETVGNVRHRIGLKADGVVDWALQDLTIITTNISSLDPLGRGSSNYALWLNGASNYAISRCNITSGNAANGVAGVNGNNGTQGGAGTAGGTGGCGIGNSNGGGGGTGGGAGAGGSGGPGANGTAGSAGSFGGGGGDDHGSSTSNTSVCQCRGSRNGRRGGGTACGNGGNGGNGSSDGSCGGSGEGSPGATCAGNAASGTDGVTTPFSFTASFYVPSDGTDGTGGTGGIGGSGGGGGGYDSEFIDVAGSGGSGGSGGGGGGEAGTGGTGGGSSFPIMRTNSNVGAVLVDLDLTAGNAGLGGTRGNGGNGGAFRAGTSGNCGCSDGNRGGAGGGGQAGGRGGHGGFGGNGLSAQVSTDGTSSSPSVSIPSFPSTTATYLGCTNSEVEITKGSGNWSLQVGSSFINDLTNTTSSYNNTSSPAIVSYTGTGAQSIVVGGTTYENYVYIHTNRALPTFAPSMPTTICEGQSFTMNTPTSGAAYEWVLFEGTNTTASPVSIYTTQIASFPSPVTGATVNYHIRLRIRDNCCGWSAPVYFDFDVVPTSAGPTVTLDTVCAGETATISTTGSGTLNWFSDPLGQVNLATGPAPTLTLNTPVLNQNTVFYAAQSVGSCVGPLTSAEVIVNQLPNQPSTNPVAVCVGQDVILTATGSGSGDLVFYDNGLNEISRTTMSSGTPNATFNVGVLAAGSYSYYVREDNGTCESPLNLIGVTINALPTAPTAANTSICAGNSVTLSATGTGVINWYGDAALTNLLGTGATYTTGNLTATTNYYITQADANNCESPTTTVTVTVNPNPVNPTATGASICAGTAATLTATGSGGTLNWFSDATTTTMVGTGTSFTTPALLQNTTYYVQETNTTTNCVSNVVAVNVIVNSLPITPNAGTPVTICVGNMVMLTATGSGTGDLVFYDNTPTEVGRITMGGNPTATFNAGALTAGNYTYTVREDNGTCLSNSISIAVNVNALPTAPTAANVTICAGSATTLTATATGTVNWYSDLALTNLIATGSVFNTGNLTATTNYYSTQVDPNGCESSPATVTVTINPLPADPTAIPDTICAGQAATLTATGAGGTLNWYSDASASILVGTGASFTTGTLAQNTTYYVQEVSASGCLSNTVALTVVVNSLANTPSTNAITICEGQDAILSATGSGSGDLVFYNNSLVEIGRVTMGGNPNATFNAGALAAGNYVYYASEDNGNCGSGLVAIGVVVNTLPITPSAVDVTICAGNSATLSTTGSVNWYSDGTLNNLVATTNNFTTNALNTTADYYVVAMDANGCSSTADTVTVTVNPLPTTPITTTDTTCEGNSATLTATGSGGTLNWYSDATATTLIGTGVTLNLPIINQTTTYYVTETNATTGCVSAIAMATVLVNPRPNPPSASDVVICSGSDVILSATGSGSGDLVFYDNNNTEIGRFTMSTGNTTGTSNAGALAVGNYVFFVAEDAGNCISTLTSINVEVRQLPAAPTAFNDSPVCEGEMVFVQANTIVGATYSWTGPNGFNTTLQNFNLPNATTAQAGTYNVAVTLNGCTSNSTPTTVTVNQRPVLAALTSNSPLCELDDLTITSVAIPGATYAWTGPNGFTATTQDITINNVLESDHQGFYSLVATDAIGCASLPVSTLVMITGLPDAGLASNNSPVCVGQTITLEVQDVFGATYAWTGPNGFSSTNRTSVITASTADTGLYTVVVTVNNCSSTYTTQVSVHPSPTITVSADTTTTVGTPLQLWASGGITYQWTPATFLDNANISNPTFLASGIGTYSYLATTYNIFGCEASDRVVVNVTAPDIEDLKIVDLFTPNGDGINDYWPVSFLQDPAIGPYTLQIVTRGGMEVLNTQNYQNDWYGTFNGQNLPDGTYWYIIRLENDNKTIKGAVTIKR